MIYKTLYPQKKKAIQIFLAHTNMAALFHVAPTDAEIKVILCMRSNESQKTIAHMLKTQPKTIESHISNIRDKLKNTTLTTLISSIRNGAYNPI